MLECPVVNGKRTPILNWQCRQPLASTADISFLSSLPFWLSVSLHVALIGAVLAFFFNPADFSVKAGHDSVSLYLVAAPAAPAPPSTVPPPSPPKPEKKPDPIPDGTVPVLATVPIPVTPPLPVEQPPTETMVLQPAPPSPEPPKPRPVAKSGDHAPHPGKDSVTAIAEGGGRPGYLDNPLPNYPEASRRAKQEGTVLVRVLINEDGHPSNIAVEESSGFGALDRAAVEALHQWRFRPATVGSTKVKSLVVIPVRFRLND